MIPLAAGLKGKLIMGAVVLVAVIIIIASINNLIKGDDKEDVEERRKEEDLIQKIEREVVRSNLSYTSNTYDLYAQRLFNAMDGAGTDSDAIEDVFNKLKNDDDYRALVSSYGTREGENLYSWLNGDLSRSSLFGLSLNDLNEILKKKGISYRV